MIPSCFAAPYSHHNKQPRASFGSHVIPLNGWMKWLCYLWQDQNITHEYDSVHYYDVGVFLLSHSEESLKKILVCLKYPIVSFLACVTKAFMTGSAARTLGLTWKNFRGDATFQFKKIAGVGKWLRSQSTCQASMRDKVQIPRTPRDSWGYVSPGSKGREIGS